MWHVQFFGICLYVGDKLLAAKVSKPCCLILCAHACALALPRTIGAGRFETVRQVGKDDHDKFSLPTGSSFAEDFLEGCARRFVTDAKFGRRGSQRFSCDEMNC